MQYNSNRHSALEDEKEEEDILEEEEEEQHKNASARVKSFEAEGTKKPNTNCNIETMSCKEVEKVMHQCKKNKIYKECKRLKEDIRIFISDFRAIVQEIAPIGKTVLLLRTAFEESQMHYGHCNAITYSQNNEGEIKEKDIEEEKAKVK